MNDCDKMTTQPKCACSWQWLKVFIAFVNFNFALSIQFIKLQRHSGTPVRLSDHYKTIDNTLLLRCSLQCDDELDCVSINYNTVTETCEMNDKSSNYGIVNLLTEQNWNIYNIVKGRFFRLDYF